jgi:hypothetical protein
MNIIIIIVIILVICCCCCCCIILGGGGYYFLQQNNDNTQSAPASGSNASAPASGSNASAPVPASKASEPTTQAPTTTTPAPTTTQEIKIPKFIIRKGETNWANLIQNGDETATNIQDWGLDSQLKDLGAGYKYEWKGEWPVKKLMRTQDNQIGVQFRYFAQFWLNKTGKSSGSTNVYTGSLSNNLGEYKFSVNGTSYTGSFKGESWSWNYSGDYCFNTINAKKTNTCMNGWEFQNGQCFASGNSNGNAPIKCSDYSWSGMAGYSKTDMDNWVKACDVSDTSNCIKK